MYIEFSCFVFFFHLGRFAKCQHQLTNRLAKRYHTNGAESMTFHFCGHQVTLCFLTHLKPCTPTCMHACVHPGHFNGCDIAHLWEFEDRDVVSLEHFPEKGQEESSRRIWTVQAYIRYTYRYYVMYSKYMQEVVDKINLNPIPTGTILNAVEPPPIP